MKIKLMKNKKNTCKNFFTKGTCTKITEEFTSSVTCIMSLICLFLCKFQILMDCVLILFRHCGSGYNFYVLSYDLTGFNSMHCGSCY